ncbi:MAG: hypothetical protein PHY72_00340 [Candidatus Pacebacteria bacterium]|nr:hypothetical protein [Candidatus Paceibacterota bacterium]
MDPTSTIATIATSTEPTSSVQVLAVDMVNKFHETFGFLVSDKLQHDILLIKILFIIFSVFCLIGAIYFYKKTGYLHLDQLETWDILKNFKDYGASKAQKQWKKIKQNFEKDDPVYWKVALLEAEKLMDEILLRMGLGPGTMDDRLSRASVDEIPNLQDVIRARNLCQDIARDPDYKLNKEDAENTLGAFEKALISLQVF